jgi:acetyl-CoA carboxylase, biotin carboxylase subunit
VPVLPGSPGVLKSPEEALELAEEIGYPVILKASAGGGGRGMRVVTGRRICPAVRAGAERGRRRFQFGRRVSGEVYRRAAPHRVSDSGRRARQRGDSGRARVQHPAAPSETGGGIALAGHDGRPAREISAACARPSVPAGYTNAGTVEFLMDETGKLYFIEVNARVQVEHPVTEFVTGIDIVKSQIRIAQGNGSRDILPGPVELRGHAIECRINAENPETFRAFARPHHGLPPAGRNRRARGHLGVHRLRDSALLRFAGGQADRYGSDRGRPSIACGARSRCSSWKEFILRFRCT